MRREGAGGAAACRNGQPRRQGSASLHLRLVVIKLDAELIRAQRAKLDAERAEVDRKQRNAEREHCYLRCPKCGARLVDLRGRKRR